MGRKIKPDEPWAVIQALDQTGSGTAVTAVQPVSSATSSAITQTTVSASSASTTTGTVGSISGVSPISSSKVDPLTGSTSSLSQGSAPLAGGSGDVLIGGSGNDTLMGFQGGTRLIGNGGADLFVVQNKIGLDQAIDFTDGQDKLMLANGLTFGSLKITQQGQDTLISSQNTALMLLHNISSNLITAADIA